MGFLDSEQLVFPYTTYLLSFLEGISMCMPETAELCVCGAAVGKKWSETNLLPPAAPETLSGLNYCTWTLL